MSTKDTRTRKAEAKANERAERMAAKLRENLRRRKAQSRDMADGPDAPLSKPGPDS